MIYLDTSVLAAYYYPEILSDQVQRYLSRQVKPALSFLTEVELYSAIARKVRSQEMEMADAKRIFATFQSHLDAELFTIIPVQNHHWRLARGWIGLFSTPLRTLDALHLSMASAEEMELVTSDKQLYRSAGILGVKARFIG